MATVAAGMRLASGAGGLASSASSSSGSRAALAAAPPQRRQQQRRQAALVVVAAGGQRRGSGTGGRKAAAPVADTDGDSESAADLADERIESVTSAAALSEDQQAQLDALAEAISAKLGALADSDDWTPGKRHACACPAAAPAAVRAGCVLLSGMLAALGCRPLMCPVGLFIAACRPDAVGCGAGRVCGVWVRPGCCVGSPAAPAGPGAGGVGCQLSSRGRRGGRGGSRGW